jgi:biotin carboxyl carrier protein
MATSLVALASMPALARAQAPAAAPVPQVEEWINQDLSVRAQATVYVAPDEAAETHGRLSPGRDVKVIATLAGGDWVQVRLPDDTIGYVKAAAVELAPTAPAAGATAQQPAAQQPAAQQPPAEQAPAPQAAADQAPAADPPATDVRPNIQTPAALEAPAQIDGRPLVRDTATLVIDGRAVMLAGIEGVVGEPVGTIQDYLATLGDHVSCSPQDDMPGYYTCHLDDAAHTDLAKLLLVNGFARIAAGAPDDYTPQQEAAEEAQKGIWALQDSCVRWAVTDAVATVAFTDIADEGLYFYDLEPYVLVDGEPVAVVFDAALGWGYFGADGQFNKAPDRWSHHLDNVYPHGKGLRDAAARQHDLKAGPKHDAAIHAADARQRAIGEHHTLAEKLGHSVPVPATARPRALDEHDHASTARPERPAEQLIDHQRPTNIERPRTTEPERREAPAQTRAPTLRPTPAAQHSPLPTLRPSQPAFHAMPTIHQPAAPAYKKH